MRRQRLVAVGWARLRPPGHVPGGGGGGGGYVAGAAEHGGGAPREVWEYLPRTEQAVRDYRASDPAWSNRPFLAGRQRATTGCSDCI